MSNKKVQYNLNNALERLSKPSDFDKIVREITAIEIPVKYIEYVAVFKTDGTVKEIDGSCFDEPVPVVDATFELPGSNIPSHMIAEVKVYIDTHTLEYDVNRLVHKILRNIAD